MKDIFYYKPSVRKTAARVFSVYSSALAKKSGNILFRTLLPYDTAHFTSFDLTKYNFDDDLDEYVRDWTEASLNSMEFRRNVDDDFIPTLSPMLGIGDYSAFVAGDIYFQPDTSWSKPSLIDIDDYKNFAPLGESVWYKRFMYICEGIIKVCARHQIPFMRGFFSPLDLAAALRGEEIYYDFYDQPDKLHALLDYCADATVFLAKDLYTLAENYLSSAEYGLLWTTKMINMSEDIACMISADLYRRFCAPATQKVIDAFGSGHMHCHSRAMYLVREICSLKNVANLWLATDPNQPRPIDNIEKLNKAASCTCLAIDCDTFEEIEQNISLLKQGNYSICLPVHSTDEAIALTDRFNKLFG